MKKKKKNLKVPKSMRKKFKEQRRFKKSINESQEKLLQRARERVDDNKFEFEISPASRKKMSEIITEFAAPLLDAANNFEDQKKAISIAIAIWNISLLPEENQSQSLKEIESIVSSSTEGDDFPKVRQEIFSYLIYRKNHLFQDIKRFVQDYEIFETSEGLYLNIASIMLSGK
ncbi:MAG: hypothetical protein KKC46_01015 [Proteobacteria bacterium]|nr:hypothetical protein [Pseudomonadota bacterium]